MTEKDAIKELVYRAGCIGLSYDGHELYDMDEKNDYIGYTVSRESVCDYIKRTATTTLKLKVYIRRMGDTMTTDDMLELAKKLERAYELQMKMDTYPIVFEERW